MAIYMWREEETPTFTGLTFTANESNCGIILSKQGQPNAVNLETSIDGITWTDYTFGNTITLANVGDKVYWRNKSTTDTGFSKDVSNFYLFVMDRSVSASGDITTLLNKNGTTTLSQHCFARLFDGCRTLITPPSLPATTLSWGCYRNMFISCSSLIEIPQLPALSIETTSYYGMFSGCTSIKLSETQTGEYQIPYRIPTTGTGTAPSGALNDMFSETGGTFTGTPTINITYYLRSGAAPVTTAGIYHNEAEGLISLSSDGENWITIADKNLGATQAWNEGDEPTQENCGGFFQTGNNYMFPFSGPEKKGYITVDFSQYGPGNYYSCDTFWTNDAEWQGIVDNPNLWGLETGTYEAMRGPCPEGYHVPKESEYWEVASMFSVPISYLKTAAVVLSNDGENKITSGWSSSPFYCTLNDDGSGYGRFVRPFKNEPVVPTSERTVLYQPN